MQVVLDFDFYVPTHSDFSVEPLPEAVRRGGQHEVALGPDDHLFAMDGSPAESLRTVLEMNAAPMEEGTFHQRAQFDDGRLIPVVAGDPIPISALLWTETMHRSTETRKIERSGEPILLLEQLDERGEAASSRLVVDRDLYAWAIEDDGAVVPRGPLDHDED